MKNIYLIRHCEAKGQEREAGLTDSGHQQALDLVEFFSNKKIERIISSPYKRAIQSVEPLAEKLNIEIEREERLIERVLSKENLPDWMDKLKLTFQDAHLKFDGGESSAGAQKRIVQVVDTIFNSPFENSIVVTHGNLLALLLNTYDDNFGFESWRELDNPDVYVLRNHDGEINFKRLWKNNLAKM